MKSTILNFLEYVNPIGLFGPIFEKELRISSRRKRHYFLRFAYLIILTAFILFLWLTRFNINSTYPKIFLVSQMSQFGIYITVTIVWFQFIAIQLIAVILLSGSISDEIYHKTLGVIMTTPISSFQIVLGKLGSKLLQLILLLAISMPLLAIIRIFGGVPWDYVLSSLCVTLTAAVFAGSISMFLSLFNPRKHSLILLTLSIGLIIYLVPILIYIILQNVYNITLIPFSYFSYFNPFIVMSNATRFILSPSAGLSIQPWIMHCLTMLGLSISFLIISTFCIRRLGLRLATGQAGILMTRKERQIANKSNKVKKDLIEAPRHIWRVKGPAIIWKEIAHSLLKNSRLRAYITVILFVLTFCGIYGYCAYKQVLMEDETHLIFIAAYICLCLLKTAGSAAVCITSEKEARTWPVFLTVPLTEKQITLGKIIGSILQAWPFWLLCAIHTLIFCMLGIINPLAIIPLFILATSSALLVSAIGVLFSSSLKRSSVASSISLLLILGFVVPFCCPLSYFISPLYHTVSILYTFGDVGDISNFAIYRGNSMLWRIISYHVFLVPVAIYLLAASIAFAISITNIRRRIF